jgi:diacylglycerol kinase family enzyme
MIAASQRPPAVAIVNPSAGRLSVAAREEVFAALGKAFRLDVLTTTGREHGIELAEQVARSGVSTVIAFGGDGLVNEVCNGLAGTSSALGIVPGGTMNVFARALGIPKEPLAAVRHLTERIGQPPREVNLGCANERYFTFSAGCGFDAEAAELVERDIPSKKRFGEVFFYWSAFRVLAGAYRHRDPTMTLSGPFGEVPVSMVVGCNTGPYAYLAGRAVRLTPRVDLDKGLDVFALKKMRVEALPRYAWETAVAGDISGHRDAFYEHDLERFTVRSDQPFLRHVDGEPLEPSDEVTFTLARRALRVHA